MSFAEHAERGLVGLQVQGFGFLQPALRLVEEGQVGDRYDRLAILVAENATSSPERSHVGLLGFVVTA